MMKNKCMVFLSISRANFLWRSLIHLASKSNRTRIECYLFAFVTAYASPSFYGEELTLYHCTHLTICLSGSRMDLLTTNCQSSHYVKVTDNVQLIIHHRYAPTVPLDVIGSREKKNSLYKFFYIKVSVHTNWLGWFRRTVSQYLTISRSRVALSKKGTPSTRRRVIDKLICCPVDCFCTLSRVPAGYEVVDHEVVELGVRLS